MCHFESISKYATMILVIYGGSKTNLQRLCQSGGTQCPIGNASPTKLAYKREHHKLQQASANSICLATPPTRR